MDIDLFRYTASFSIRLSIWTACKNVSKAVTASMHTNCTQATERETSSQAELTRKSRDKTEEVDPLLYLDCFLFTGFPANGECSKIKVSSLMVRVLECLSPAGRSFLKDTRKAPSWSCLDPYLGAGPSHPFQPWSGTQSDPTHFHTCKPLKIRAYL